MNFWKEFIEKDSIISAKLNGLPKIDPMIEMVDAAIEEWVSKKRDVIFEATLERREMLIRIVKKAVDYDLIEESPFYQYVRAYILHLYFWLVRVQQTEVEMGNQRKVDYLGIYEAIISESFRLGFALGKERPKKKGS